MSTALTTKQRIAKYGNPFVDQLGFERAHMQLFDIPDEINRAIPCLPNKVYMNKACYESFIRVLRKLMFRGLHAEIKTWGGCFNVRKKRGSNSISMHAWGLAVDMNEAWNPLVKNVTPLNRASLRKTHVKWTEAFLDCWREEGWGCGADWANPLDGMHFQYPF